MAEPGSKRIKSDVRYNIQFRFSNEEHKRDFISLLERARKTLSVRTARKFESNVEFFKELFTVIIKDHSNDTTHDSDDTTSQAEPIVPRQPMLSNAGVYTTPSLYSNIGEMLFVGEVGTVCELSQCLSNDCVCGSREWMLDREIRQVLYIVHIYF
jgi:hypothetical protein